MKRSLLGTMFTELTCLLCLALSVLMVSEQILSYLRRESQSCNRVFQLTGSRLLQKMVRVGIIKWEAAANHSVKNYTKTPDIAGHAIIRDTCDMNKGTVLRQQLKQQSRR